MMGVNGVYNPGLAQTAGTGKAMSGQDGNGRGASFGEILKARMDAVSYTHLTLPTT